MAQSQLAPTGEKKAWPSMAHEEEGVWPGPSPVPWEKEGVVWPCREERGMAQSHPGLVGGKGHASDKAYRAWGLGIQQGGWWLY